MSKKVKNILAICWGMQVAVTAAGGVVKKSSNGAHIGIANQLIINEQGIKHPLYSGKKIILILQHLTLMKWYTSRKWSLLSIK